MTKDSRIQPATFYPNAVKTLQQKIENRMKSETLLQDLHRDHTSGFVGDQLAEIIIDPQPATPLPHIMQYPSAFEETRDKFLQLPHEYRATAKGELCLYTLEGTLFPHILLHHLGGEDDVRKCAVGLHQLVAVIDAVHGERKDLFPLLRCCYVPLLNKRRQVCFGTLQHRILGSRHKFLRDRSWGLNLNSRHTPLQKGTSLMIFFET